MYETGGQLEEILFLMNVSSCQGLTTIYIEYVVNWVNIVINYVMVTWVNNNILRTNLNFH